MPKLALVASFGIVILKTQQMVWQCGEVLNEKM
jgi:hypothetical protein